MLSEVHVAVLPAANLRADLFALEQELNSTLADAPGYLAFISGPSRTGDIELVLTLGPTAPVSCTSCCWRRGHEPRLSP